MVNVNKALAPRRGRKRKTDPKKAVAYIRVSTRKQVLGPQAQRDALEAYALAQGIEVVGWYAETVGGSAPLSERVELFMAIDRAKAERAGTLLVAKRDRFARDPFLCELLERDMTNAGIELVATDNPEANGDDPTAILMRRMLDAIAEYERALISARTKAALATKKRRGLRGPGSIPFGKQLGTDGVTLEDHPQEAIVVGRILRDREAGSSLQAITDALNANDVRARGKRWHRTTVSRIIKGNR